MSPPSRTTTARSKVSSAAQAAADSGPTGSFVEFDGEVYYCISGYDAMPPFLMTLAGDTDIWAFITSGGGITAGRVNPDRSLFPYETADRLHDAHHHSGPLTLFRIAGSSPEDIWEPFGKDLRNKYSTERRLYKNVSGTRIVFEETNNTLGLRFRYRWSGADSLGLVRSASLTNLNDEALELSLFDGFRNVLPFGAPLALYQQSSCLIDAYKRSEIDEGTGLGIFSLTSKIVDRPVAAEVLRANTVWHHGLPNPQVYLAAEAVEGFRSGKPVPRKDRLNGERGNYFVSATVRLASRQTQQWYVAADAGQSIPDIESLRLRLQDKDTDPGIEAVLDGANKNLRRIVGSSDGLQTTKDTAATAHHFANVMFNAMRGGVFDHNYWLSGRGFARFVEMRNSEAVPACGELIADLPEPVPLKLLLQNVREVGNPDLERLCYEYPPLYFGRRHGDPSRPWNRFSIRVKQADGLRALHYEGNWRDIFQNWEALGTSFPQFLPGMIAKFVNASTVDGFNPFRITEEGVDWEVTDPRDPWSFIGYWGDHQIVYLLKLLERLPHFTPGALEEFLGKEIFSYANVPYNLKSYSHLLENPFSTIEYRWDVAAKIEEQSRTLGTDARLLLTPSGDVYHVNLLEKLLVPALSKLSNFVPEGGIWMNTQRPEWNDANNALAGNGLSMVTLYHLRKYLSFLEDLLKKNRDPGYSVSSEVAEWLREIHQCLEENQALLSIGFTDSTRKKVVDGLGLAFERYRFSVYHDGFSGREPLHAGEVESLCELAGRYLSHSIDAGRREDGLFHSYNLLIRTPNALSVRSMHEMLEGQVAALASGTVSAEQTLEVISALFRSKLYRSDQKSFLLYPETELPGFLEQNRIPEDKLLAVPVLTRLLEIGDRSIVEQDVSGAFRFSGDISEKSDVLAALNTASAFHNLEISEQDRSLVSELFEDTFDHESFTGRSGTMYAYEGLGCIYWHMVSKLILAVQEVILDPKSNASNRIRDSLIQAYYQLRSGLCFEKTVDEYGAFPTDPYSHTPGHGGAQQPGMTGQVKEGILLRMGELGIQVREGSVHFSPVLLRPHEFLDSPETLTYFDVGGKEQELSIPKGSLAFTFCQVPVLYKPVSNEAWIRVTFADGEVHDQPGSVLSSRLSETLFSRSGEIARIDVRVPKRVLHTSGSPES